jgi:DsbC/DsbD-like thiol-disulfide interchange protein
MANKYQPKLRALSAVFLLLITPVAAASQNTVRLEGATVGLQSAPLLAQSLLADVIEVSEEETLVFLSINLNPGWKTYWRLPGRFGLAPTLAWSTGADERLKAQVYFPRPVLFSEGEGTSIGYQAPVIWPIVINAQGVAHLTLDFGLCEALCLPETVRLSVDMEKLDALQPVPLSKVLQLAGTLPQMAGPDTQDALQGPLTGFMVLENDRHHLLITPETATTWPFEHPFTRITIVPPEGSPQVFMVDERQGQH